MCRRPLNITTTTTTNKQTHKQTCLHCLQLNTKYVMPIAKLKNNKVYKQMRKKKQGYISKQKKTEMTVVGTPEAQFMRL